MVIGEFVGTLMLVVFNEVPDRPETVVVPLYADIQPS